MRTTCGVSLIAAILSGGTLLSEAPPSGPFDHPYYWAGFPATGGAPPGRQGP